MTSEKQPLTDTEVRLNETVYTQTAEHATRKRGPVTTATGPEAHSMHTVTVNTDTRTTGDHTRHSSSASFPEPGQEYTQTTHTHTHTHTYVHPDPTPITCQVSL